jgi:hypothetical protein
MAKHQCVDCGERVGIRATRCKDCRRIHRTKYERDRVTAAREKRAAEESACEGYDFPPLGGLVDYTRPGSASKPPSFGNHPVARQESRPEEAVDYTKGGHSRPGIYEKDASLAKVPGAARHDFVQAHQMARTIAQAEAESELSSWEVLQLQGQPDGHLVSFRPAMDGSILRGGSPVTASPYASAILGQVARGPQPRPQQAGPRTPHILN